MGRPGLCQVGLKRQLLPQEASCPCGPCTGQPGRTTRSEPGQTATLCTQVRGSALPEPSATGDPDRGCAACTLWAAFFFSCDHRERLPSEEPVTQAVLVTYLRRAPTARQGSLQLQQSWRPQHPAGVLHTGASDRQCTCGSQHRAYLQQSTAMEEARNMSCDSSGTFHTRHVLSMPPETARSARPTSTARASACEAGCAWGVQAAQAVDEGSNDTP